MLSEDPAKRIVKLQGVEKVGYRDYHIWILVDDITDLLECNREPKKRRLDYNIVQKESEIPVTANIIE